MTASISRNLNLNYEEMACGECGVSFLVPDYFYKERLHSGKGWYCPNGHNRVFKESKVSQLEKKLEQERQSTLRWQNNFEEEKRKHAATKGSLTKIKTRVAAGVCPCCNRTFKNLARHMKCKHPAESKSGD